MPANIKGRWEVEFPDPENSHPNGLVAYGGDLAPATLLSAYGQGVFPWYSESEPILWWSPDPRCALFPDDFHISSRSRRKIRNSGFLFSIDRAFDAVMLGCAMPRKDCDSTWLSPEMQAAYSRLFDLGCAHSIEIWKNSRLVGGLYGVAMGQAFFGESMFRMAPEASRAALLLLVSLGLKLGLKFVDCQIASPHMLAMGAVNVPRRIFLALVRDALSRHVAKVEKAGWRKFERALAGTEGLRPKLEKPA